ncbi:hypothetical protein [Moritella sp. F3]|uniref:hypothetical protein n=1 Tax=Moritella sp. F3 TaxID=2718882 RepID=UPI0018E1AE60|nr:hypothetical protein [Moritella sp. F3]GIC77156.1 hypothetical protein FMO001_18830 [Moritella sp. F1]GIC82275.1 hypothetical protein FMO003_25560 [Moritella sp. F3]
MTKSFNQTCHGSYLFNLVIEDDADPQYSNAPAVDPRGPYTRESLTMLAIEIYSLGIELDYWSESASLYLSNVCLGAGEVFDPKLPLQGFFSDLASKYHAHGGGQIDTCSSRVRPIVMDCVSPDVEFMDVAKAINSNYENCAQPYAIPFVVYEQSYDDTNKSFSDYELEQFAEIGKGYFGEAATTLILPVCTSVDVYQSKRNEISKFTET